MRSESLLTTCASVVLLPLLLLVRSQSAGDSPHGDLDIDCGQCHSADGWLPLAERPSFSHDTTGFPLVEAHSQARCTACHTSLVFHQVGVACADCHADVHRGELGFRCETCHTPRTWDNQRELRRVHERTRFPLFGAHTTLDCEACHAGQRPYQYVNTPTECGACHFQAYDETSDPDHGALGFGRQCEGCHLTFARTWRETSFQHPASFPLRGAHQLATCQDCHAAGYVGAPSECAACHRPDYDRTTNPNHVASSFPLECESCHRETGWHPADFDHGLARFPLTGAHLAVDCEECHTNRRFTGTPSECSACHQADYRATSSPNHAAVGFPLECAACHTTSGWTPADFDHNQTRFQLRGAHRGPDCSACHTGGIFAGTPTQCVACHRSEFEATRNPDHVAAGFPITCQSCHDQQSWDSAVVDHDATRFPLTGAHRRLDCASCHRGGTFAGTPRACFACHQSDYQATQNPNHASSGFPTRCQDCHSTSAWRPAEFDHDGAFFPIHSGEHRGVWNACADCHPNPGNFRAFECINCHEHRKPRMDDKHEDVTGYQYLSVACLDCHPQGRE